MLRVIETSCFSVNPKSFICEERIILEPRKKDSIKWTTLPPDFSAQIKAVFEENFKEYLKNKTLKVEGRIYPSEIILRIGIQEKGRLKNENFEVSLDHSPSKQNTIPMIHLSVDAIASLMIEYFEKQTEAHETDSEIDMDLPYLWKEIPFEKETIWFQFTTENPDLEAEADKLLGLTEEDGLLHGSEDEDDVEAAMDLDEENDLLDSSSPSISPSMFSGKKKKEDMH